MNVFFFNSKLSTPDHYCSPVFFAIIQISGVVKSWVGVTSKFNIQIPNPDLRTAARDDFFLCSPSINIWNEIFNDFEFQLNNVRCVMKFHITFRVTNGKCGGNEKYFTHSTRSYSKCDSKQFPRIFTAARRALDKRFFIKQLLLWTPRQWKKELKRIFRRCQQFN